MTCVKYYYEILFNANYRSIDNLLTESVRKIHNRFMFFTSVLFVINLIELDNHINIGFLKGTLPNTNMLILFIFAINIYYAIYLFITVKPYLEYGNKGELLKKFIGEIAGIVANNEINEKLKEQAIFSGHLKKIVQPDYKPWEFVHIEQQQCYVSVKKEFKYNNEDERKLIERMVTGIENISDWGCKNSVWTFSYLLYFDKQDYIKYFRAYKSFLVFRNWNHFFICFIPYIWLIITATFTVLKMIK